MCLRLNCYHFFGPKMTLLGQCPLKDNKATGFGFDVGAHSKIKVKKYSPLNSICLGISLKDLGIKLKWDTDSSYKDKVPLTMCFGTGLDFRLKKIPILAVLEGSKTSDEGFKVHFGVETWPYKILGLRAGLDDKDLSLGFSLKYRQIQLDYAFCSDILDEGATNKIGLQAKF